MFIQTMIFRAPPLFLCLILLAACGEGTARQVLGFDKAPPDAFAVSPEAPLEVPDNLTALPLPQPGQARPNTVTPAEAAQGIINGAPGITGARAMAPVAPSPAEAALLAKAGVARADPALRPTINREAQQDARAQKGTFLAGLLFWQGKPQPGVAVDPAAESSRLKQNAAKGQPVNAGGTPVVQDNARIRLPKTIQ